MTCHISEKQRFIRCYLKRMLLAGVQGEISSALPAVRCRDTAARSLRPRKPWLGLWRHRFRAEGATGRRLSAAHCPGAWSSIYEVFEGRKVTGAYAVTQPPLCLVWFPFSLPCIHRGLYLGHTGASPGAGAKEEKPVQNQGARAVIS